MKLTKSIVALTSLVAFAATPLFAGTGKTFKETVVVEEAPTPWYNAALSTGWDSLYMFRGANVLGGDGKYGSSISWTDANFTWNITDNDLLTLGGWMGFGLGQGTNYKEFDAYANYVHTFGDLSVGLGYTLYYVFGNGNLYANELNASVAYAFDLGFMTVTPSVKYFFNLGPDNDTGNGNGIVGLGTSYLDLRVTGSIPVYKKVVSIDPWSAFGVNFGYNQNGSGSEFDGANNLEFGVAIPVKINDVITVSGYVAYSYAFQDLWATTKDNTFWGGAKVAFSF